MFGEAGVVCGGGRWRLKNGGREMRRDHHDAVANEFFFNSVCDLVERKPSIDELFTLEQQYLKVVH